MNTNISSRSSFTWGWDILEIAAERLTAPPGWWWEELSSATPPQSPSPSLVGVASPVLHSDTPLSRHVSHSRVSRDTWELLPYPRESRGWSLSLLLWWWWLELLLSWLLWWLLYELLCRLRLLLLLRLLPSLSRCRELDKDELDTGDDRWSRPCLSW